MSYLSFRKPSVREYEDEFIPNIIMMESNTAWEPSEGVYDEK